MSHDDTAPLPPSRPSGPEGSARTGTDANAPNADVFLNPFGRAISVCRLYGLRHQLTVKAMEDAFESLLRLMRSVAEVHMVLADDALIVNGNKLGSPGPLTLTAIATMRQLGVAGLRFVPGISPDEFIKVMGLLTANPKDLAGKPFAEHMADAGLAHVGIRTGTYRQVYDDQVVLDRKDDAKAPKPLADGPGAEQVIAFLKGTSAPGEQMPFPSVEVVENDVHGLAGILLRVAQSLPAPDASAGGETLGDSVATCLRRAFKGLSLDPAVKTQKGKKKLSKTLALLEADILDKMGKMSPPAAPAAAAKVSALAEELRDELDIDAIVAEYARRKKAFDASEKRILRLMGALGPDGIAEAGMPGKMAEAGVASTEWQKLAARIPGAPVLL